MSNCHQRNLRLGRRGGVLNTTPDRNLLNGSGCGTPPELPSFTAPLRMGKASHRDSESPYSSIGDLDISTWPDNIVAKNNSADDVTSPRLLGQSAVVPQKSIPLRGSVRPVSCSHPGRFEGDIFQRFRRIREIPLLPNKSRNYIQAGANISSVHHEKTVTERCVNLMIGVAVDFNGIPEECRRALATVKYLVTSAVFSGYALEGEERLTIFNLLCGHNWRSHEKKLSRYIDGCWKRRGDRIEFTSQEELTAVEGLFISLACEEPSWK